MIPPQFRRLLAPAGVAMLTGLLLVLQLKTHAKVQQTGTEMRVSEEMVAQLLRATEARDRLTDELAHLRETAQQQLTVRQLRDELELGLAAAGQLPVAGPGVSVVMADLEERTGPTRRVDTADVLTVLNELRAAGAEAIAVNGIRVTPRFFMAGDRRTRHGIVVNGVPAEETFRVTAVGDPKLLASSLNMRGGVVSTLSQWIYISVTEFDRLVIPPADQVPPYIYARPAR